MQNDLFSLALIVFCIIMSAYFSATETAFSSLNRIKIKNMAEKGNKRAALVAKLGESYDTLLSTILIGNNIVNIACASLATLIFVRMLGEESGASVSTVVTTIVVLIFGEVSPKSIAKESPEQFAMFSAPLLRIFIVCLTPLNFLFRQWKKLLSKVFKSPDDKGITEEELLTMVEEAQQEGGIDEQEGALIRNAIEFSELEAYEIMTPRLDMVGVTLQTPEEEVAHIFAQTGFSRLLVYEENMDHIAGVIYLKDFHNQVYHTGQALDTILRPALFVMENQKIDLLLKELQQKKLHLAVVVDEFGGTSGLVTLEDILEELVGEIWDEHDQVVQEVERLSDTEFLARGTAHVEDLFEAMGREEEFESVTVSGWVMEHLGGSPREGDQFTYKGLQVTIQKMIGRRIAAVHIQATGPRQLPPES